MRNLIDAGPEINDADSAVAEFLHSWWVPGRDTGQQFTINTAKECMQFHFAHMKRTVQGGVNSSTPSEQLFRTPYVFPSSAWGDVPVPPGKQPCTRCRLYRAVAIVLWLLAARTSCRTFAIWCKGAHQSFARRASFLQGFRVQFIGRDSSQQGGVCSRVDPWWTVGIGNYR